ncbi:MAG: hypothetical protein JKY70_05665 [Mucilaginibacter sp.]|nr:hypothetical protein [Mucilaginibacter sp.]
MQTPVNHKITICFVAFFCVASMISCRKEESPFIETSPSGLNRKEAQNWFGQQLQQTDHARVKTYSIDSVDAISKLEIDWDKYTGEKTGKLDYGLVSLNGQVFNNNYQTGYRKLLIEKNQNDTLSGHILEIIPDGLYLQTHGIIQRKDFSGRVFFYDLHYRLKKGLVYENGTLTGEIKPSSNKTQLQREVTVMKVAPIPGIDGWHDHNYINGEGEVVIYSERISSPATINDNFGSSGGFTSGGDFTGSGGGGGGAAGTAPPVSNLPGENNNKIDPKSYMKCFQSLPDAGSKMTITVYVQEPAPGLPFNIGSNSVGHTAIGLTKTYNGQSITQVIGFYPDATGKEKMHAPSKILDNSGLSYTVSISYTVIASEFSKIINFLSDPPKIYDLTQYNCTSFVNEACLKGGIKLPDPTGNMGLGTSGMMPSALGLSIRQVGSTGNANVNGGTVPLNHGPCN